MTKAMARAVRRIAFRAGLVDRAGASAVPLRAVVVRLRSASEQPSLLFMTGDVLGEKTETYLKEHGTLCVSKPFSLETFCVMVKKSLDQSKN